MTTKQRNAIGYAMLGAGVLLMLVSALLAWNSVQRWFAVSETREAFKQLRQGRIIDARRFAARAVARTPDEPAPALLAVDPADEAALERLVTIAVLCKRPADRQATLAAIGLMRLAAGKPADVELDGTADGRLLAALAAANAGREPGRIEPADGEAPPHLHVLRAAHTVLLRRAWQAGQVPETCAHAGALLLLMPKAPEAPALRFLLAACSSERSDQELRGLGEAIKTEREAVVRAVAALLPARRSALAGFWPAAVEGQP